MTDTVRRNSRLAVPALLVVLGGLAGCGSTTGSGSASPTPTPTPSATPTPSPSAASSLNAAGIDPCMLLTDAARGAFKIDNYGPTDSGDFNGATCRYVQGPEVQYDVTATDGLSLPQLRSQAQAQGRDDTDVEIGGFPALVTTDASSPTLCTVGVGVSSTGQVVVTGQDSEGSSAQQDSLCAHTKEIAEAALDGLSAQQ